jgi:uncharacterized protein (TIGR00251 family)
VTSLPQALAILRSDDGLLVGVRASPSAPRTALRGMYGSRLKVSLSAPPEDNRANTELLRAFSSWLGVSRDCVRLQSGHGSRDKVVAFAGMEEAELREKLTGLMQRDWATKGEERHGS